MTHLPFGTMIDYVRDLGSGATREVVRAHLAECPRCAAAVTRLGRLAAIARAEAVSEPPDEVVNAAIALFNGPPPDHRSVADMARLVFDSASEQPPPQPDQTGASSRVLRFETADHGIDLHLLVTEYQVRVSVAGQITTRVANGPVIGAISAHRELGQRPLARTRFTDSGEFRLDYAPPAAAILQVVVSGSPLPITVVVTAAAV